MVHQVETIWGRDILGMSVHSDNPIPMTSEIEGSQILLLRILIYLVATSMIWYVLLF